jgi:arylsulfatase
MITCLRLIFVLVTIFAAVPSGWTANLDRSVLPIPEPTYPPSKVLDVRNATPPPRFEVKAPEGAPNVIVPRVILDISRPDDPRWRYCQ